MPKSLKTSDIAQIVGVHSNTVRLYEEKGFLPPIPRSQTGYRLFTSRHLEQMHLAHLALQGPYSGSQQVVIHLVKCAAEGDLGMAMEWAYEYLAQVRMERTRAEAALEFLERWARGQVLEITKRPLTIGQVAEHLGITVDQLHNWDRNGLLSVPRDPETGYRLYGASEMGRLRVIRVLRQSGYSLMSILRMLQHFDAGKIDHLRQVLDTPGEDEVIETVADRWLTTLTNQEKRAQDIIQHITVMMNTAFSGHD